MLFTLCEAPICETRLQDKTTPETLSGLQLSFESPVPLFSTPIENLFLCGCRVQNQLTFLGKRQVATEFFFSVVICKNLVAEKCQ